MTTLAERMEAREAEQTRRAKLGEVVYVRLDGRNFSRWTSGLEKPFCAEFADTMDETTKALVEESGAILGYTQSDEITLILYREPPGEIYFGGKLDKIVSLLAVEASMVFSEEWRRFDACGPVSFDARAFIMREPPTGLIEALNVLRWRERDATRNAILGLGQARYSHKSLQGVRCSEILERLQADGVDFEAMPERFRRGAYFQRRKVLKELDAETLAKIPEQHRPGGPVERHEVDVLEDVSFPWAGDLVRSWGGIA